MKPTMAQLSALDILAAAPPGEAAPAFLAAGVGENLWNRLVNGGLVERRNTPSGKGYVLTPEGDAARAKTRAEA